MTTSCKPYTSISPSEYNDDDFDDCYNCDDPGAEATTEYLDNEIAVQSLELEAATVKNKKNSFRRVFFVIFGMSFILSSLISLGKYYHDNGRLPEFLSGSSSDEDNSSDANGDETFSEVDQEQQNPNNEYSIASEIFQGANKNGDGIMVSVKQDEEDSNGVLIGVSNLDDSKGEEAEEDWEETNANVEDGEIGGVEDTSEGKIFESAENVTSVSINIYPEGVQDISKEDQMTLNNTFAVLEKVIHDASSFTQGLSYGSDGIIYESTGLYGQSKVRKINPYTFNVELSVDIEHKYFGEGSTYFTDADGNARIIHITWQEQTGFIYDADTLETISSFNYETTAPGNEGWGITYDATNQEFVVSDGSSFLYFWDRDTLKQKRYVEVTRFGLPQDMLNELEWMNGLVCCNIWYSDLIICVDPITGNSVREYDMSSLWPANERGYGDNVLNGIALGKDHVLITGKKWDRMYKITFPDWPTLFSGEQEVKDNERPISYTIDGVENSNEENETSSSNQSNLSLEQDELPDYFVPLTSEERNELKDKLRTTLLQTVSSLHLSANPQGIEGHPFPQRTFVIDPNHPKQFMHMHHMKTGGTSIDGLIRCALARQRELNNEKTIKYASLSECGGNVKHCMEMLATELNATVVDNVFFQKDDTGKALEDSSFDPATEELEKDVIGLNVCKTSESAVMSYCASLHTVRTFGWKDVDKITVIRDPVERAWSMYRFTLQGCYKCEELKAVLEKVYNGTFAGKRSPSDSVEMQNFVYDPSDSCAVQMIGHQATNLLSSLDLYNVANDVRFPRERDIVDEAVKNLREEFTWIGITNRLEESVESFRTIFPFLALNLTDDVMQLEQQFDIKGHQLLDRQFSIPDGFVDTKGCPLEHRNEGRPSSCGTKEMDDETINWIKKLNNRDVAVYKAAVEKFELQMEVLNEYKASI